MNICNPCGLPTGIKIEDLGLPDSSIRLLFTKELNGSILVLNQSIPITRLIGTVEEIDPVTGEVVSSIPTPQGVAELHIRFAGDLDIATTEYDDIVIPQYNAGVYDVDNTKYENEYWSGTIPIETINKIPKETIVYITMGLTVGSEVIIDEACGLYAVGGV